MKKGGRERGRGGREGRRNIIMLRFDIILITISQNIGEGPPLLIYSYAHGEDRYREKGKLCSIGRVREGSWWKGERGP